MRNASDKVEEKIKTQIFTFFFVKSRRLWDNVEKYGIVRRTTDKKFFETRAVYEQRWKNMGITDDYNTRRRKDAICMSGN